MSYQHNSAPCLGCGSLANKVTVAREEASNLKMLIWGSLEEETYKHEKSRGDLPQSIVTNHLPPRYLDTGGENKNLSPNWKWPDWNSKIC